MDRPIISPYIYAVRGHGRPELLGGEFGHPDGNNAFGAHTFVVLTAGFLALVANGGVLSCGLSLDASKTTALVDPPYQMFGDKHFPVSLRGTRFAISVVDGAGNIGQANGAPQLSEVTVGEKYGIRVVNGVHCLDVDNTTNDFFVVVEKPSVLNGVAQNAVTYNPVVIVEVIDAAIQQL